MNKAEFADFRYYLEMGQDLTFSYDGKVYIVDGYHEKDGSPYQLQTTQIEPFEPENTFVVSDLYTYNVQEFLNTKFFDGKSFSEIIDDVNLVAG